MKKTGAKEKNLFFCFPIHLILNHSSMHNDTNNNCITVGSPIKYLCVIEVKQSKARKTQISDKFTQPWYQVSLVHYFLPLLSVEYRYLLLFQKLSEHRLSQTLTDAVLLQFDLSYYLAIVALKLVEVQLTESVGSQSVMFLLWFETTQKYICANALRRRILDIST